MKVLVTGAGALLGQGIIRALKRSELQTTIVAVDPSPLSAGLYWVDRGHLVPMARDADYLDEVRRIMAIERPDVVLIGTDVELFHFAEHRAALEEEFDTQILVSSREVIHIADDKYATYEFLVEHGFDAPPSCLPPDVEDLVAEIGFPLIVKPRVGARSIGVHRVENLDELAAAIGTVDNPVIQECISDASQEYTAGVLVFDGECKASIVMRRDLRDGNTYRAYVEDFPELNDEIRRIGAALNPHGPANFQFRVDDEGRVKVFEINARFSGTTPLRALAGMNEVEMALRHVVNGDPIEQPEVEPITILRHWSETVVPGKVKAPPTAAPAHTEAKPEPVS